jgi:hypothetical protein
LLDLPEQLLKGVDAMALVLHTVVIDSVVSLVIGTSALAYLLCGARLMTRRVRK